MLLINIIYSIAFSVFKSPPIKVMTIASKMSFHLHSSEEILKKLFHKYIKLKKNIYCLAMIFFNPSEMDTSILSCTL